MLIAAPLTLPEAALEEAKAYLRISGTEEDALVRRLAASAAELCEQFTSQPLLARTVTETVPARHGGWIRLQLAPVQAIEAVEALPIAEPPFALPVEAYRVDIDAAGEGWVRILDPAGAGRARIRYRAGLAAEWSGVPDALRQGVARLAAHLHSHRTEAAGAEPPAAVTALWRPWRRLRLL